MDGACVVYSETSNAPEVLGAGLSAERHASIRWRSVADLFTGEHTVDEAAVVIVERTLLERFGELRGLPDHFVFVAADAESEATLGRRADITTAGVSDDAARVSLLDAACRLAFSKRDGAHLREQISTAADE